jgi:hypothetical protein
MLAYSNPQELRARLSESSNKGNRSEGVPLGFASTGPDAVGFYEQCGFPALHRTLAHVGSRMRRAVDLGLSIDQHAVGQLEQQDLRVVQVRIGQWRAPYFSRRWSQRLLLE